MHTPLFHSLYRDGIVYFFVIFATALSNMIVMYVAAVSPPLPPLSSLKLTNPPLSHQPELGQLMVMIYRMLLCIMASRIVPGTSESGRPRRRSGSVSCVSIKSLSPPQQ